MFFLPYKDDNPTRSTPIVNWLLIMANLWVFFTWQFPLGSEEQAAYFSSFGFIPATFFQSSVLWSQDDPLVSTLEELFRQQTSCLGFRV